MTGIVFSGTPANLDEVSRAAHPERRGS
jgi:hypothetical protein